MTAAQACDLLTIGHSNLPADRFITLLRDSKVSVIIDVRSVPLALVSMVLEQSAGGAARQRRHRL